MTPTWRSEDSPTYPPIRILDWGRVALRGIALLGVLVLGVLLTALLRLIERPVYGTGRPWTGWITVLVCRLALWIMRLRVIHTGAPMERDGAFVANHSSWLDIFVLNAAAPLFFVSKAEVAGWPGIGWLARITGTVFVRRNRQEADRQRALLEGRIAEGHRLLFFPEGTSTDGRRVLPFKPTLFAALFSEALSDIQVQPVSVVYAAPDGRDPRFYGWWGDMEFGPHLLHVLAARRQGKVEVVWHPPLQVADFIDRKTLAHAAEQVVRKGHPLGQDGSVEADE